MTRFLLHALAALAIAGIVHVFAVAAVPALSPRDAWTQVGAFGPDGRLNPVPRAAPGVATLPQIDPAMAHAVCRFDLAAGPMRIRARITETYWSVALFDRSGANLYSLTDRAAEGRPINLIVATPEQISQLRERPLPDSNEAIVVDWPASEGFVLMRVFVTSESAAPDVDRAIRAATCDRAQPR